MRYFFALLCAVLMGHSAAQTVPIGVGSIVLGMNKDGFIKAASINPINCETYRDPKGEKKRRGLDALDAEQWYLCWRLPRTFRTGSYERIDVENVSYEVIWVQANLSEPGQFVDSVGFSITGFFLNDRLVRLEIFEPNVSLEILEKKYGAPKVVENTKVEICTTNIGIRVPNKIGSVSSIWKEGAVTATYSKKFESPVLRCDDRRSSVTYTIENIHEVSKIRAAIEQHTMKAEKENLKRSLF